jgi:hypothetical protein
MTVVDKKSAWKKGDVLALLERSDRAVERAVMAIYSRQTDKERLRERTEQRNGCGFSKFDAHILSSFAVSITRYGHLTRNQLAVARPRIMRYHRQLVEIIEQNAANLAKLSGGASCEN